MKFRTLALAGAILAVGGGGLALAQITVAPVLNVGTTDLVPVVPGGAGTSQSRFASPQQISGTQGYHDSGAALTAWTYTFTAGQVNFLIQPAGALATGTLTTEANPGDGQTECFFSTQTQTALTWTANTGQTMGTDKPTAGVANTQECMVYESASATWHRTR